MSDKTTAFYRGNTEISVDFTAEQISSDGSVVLLEKLEREHQVISSLAAYLPDERETSKIKHSVGKILTQRVFGIMHGYEDANDAEHLGSDPLYRDVLDGQPASQPTISRLENTADRGGIFRLCEAWVDRYVDSLEGRKELIIDADATDDPTHGDQQLSLFHGYHGQYMYDQLFLHDGQTGQIILPVLRPGNSHSGRWFVGILRRVIEKIRARWPQMSITIRGDCGFSCAGFYQLAQTYQLGYVIGLPSNTVLKRKTKRVERAVRTRYADRGEKHQHFFSYTYQAGSWAQPQRCYAKVESTGKGLNVRHIASNLAGDGRHIYKNCYVKRGEASENRIKEVKNMCYSDRLSNHKFWANYLRLLISCMAYELFLLLKQAIAKTNCEEAKTWQIDTLRTRLLKVGATLHKTKRRIYYRLSRAFAYKGLFKNLLMQ